MSISPAQLSLPIASLEGLAESRPAGQAPSAANTATGSAAKTPSPASAHAPAPANPVTTDLKIDNQHQFYYEFVDGSTGSVVFEIPPEALRAIGESLNLPLHGDTSAHSVDVKS